MHRFRRNHTGIILDIENKPIGIQMMQLYIVLDADRLYKSDNCAIFLSSIFGIFISYK